MFLVIASNGKFWDGFGWSEQGREFFSPAAAVRSLHEEGEDAEKVSFVEVGNDPT